MDGVDNPQPDPIRFQQFRRRESLNWLLGSRKGRRRDRVERVGLLTKKIHISARPSGLQPVPSGAPTALGGETGDDLVAQLRSLGFSVEARR